MTTISPAQRNIYSVSRLTREVKDLLEHSFPLLWIEGEISNFARPASGHWYFSLKDADGQVRCAMFRNKNMLSGLKPANGMQVLVRARVTMYPARGEFQLVIEQIEESGEGALRREFERLKKQLTEEGLFDEAHKQFIPAVPARIGIITSATGAALRDILSVLGRRNPLAEVIIYPVPVQGDAAPPAIVKALKTATLRNEVDVLLITRGGGSLEDLWAFNDETVVRAAHACPLPVVSGVGHEIDFTLTDFVADQRAPTPSAAAELVSPDQREWLLQLDKHARNLATAMQRLLSQHRQSTGWLSQRMTQLHPGRQLEQQMQRLDELDQRLTRSVGSALQHHRLQLDHLNNRFKNQTPRPGESRRQLDELLHRLQTGVSHLLERKNNLLALQARELDSISPLKTLQRGYAVARKTDGSLIRKSVQMNKGDSFQVKLSQGSLDATVTEINDK